MDIACDAGLVTVSKQVAPQLPVCVSAVKPRDFVAAVAAGADMVEIGNFDGFYEQGIEFSAEEVLEMAKETRALLPDTPLSVTIPHNLPLAAQVKLAQQLEKCGADVLQTEGKVSASPAAGLGVQQMIELAAPTLAAAYALSAAVDIPVMCASGLTDVTAPFALAAGARGVGVGSMINRLSDRQHMLLAVASIAHALGRKACSPQMQGDATVDMQQQQLRTVKQQQLQQE